MAGTINLSLSQQLDEYGQPLAGGQLYIIQAGTVSTPQNAYQDTGLAIPLPNPITLDAAGRIPQFFLADGTIKVRLQDKYGIVKFTADGLLVIGPSAGGGGGGASVDPNAVLQTGDIKIRYDNVVIGGFVRLNGRTIGSSGSGATELADPSAQALFLHLWAKDTTLAVVPSRGASAAADWAANKQMTLPDGRSRLIAALGDMGSTDNGLLAGIGFTKGNSTTLGSTFGLWSKAIPLAALPAHAHSVYVTPSISTPATASTTVTINDPGHAHSYTQMTLPIGSGLALGSGEIPSPVSGTTGSNTTGITASASTSVTVTPSLSVSIGSAPGANDKATANAGSSAAMDMSNAAMLMTVYMRL
jgi:hypothetical protein